MSQAGKLSLRLATHASTVQWEQIPATAVRAAKWSLLDALGVSLAASRLGEGCGAFAQLAAQGGGPCQLLGRPARTSASLAALANGALAHALDFEDVYDDAPVHASAAAVPAALALAQQRGGVSGADLVAALAIGTDLSCRLGLALLESPERWGWYPPPILGAQGAATACARLLRLDAAHYLDAWSLALCQSTCSNEFKHTADSTLRAVRDGFAAQAGLQGALLAALGARGFDAPFEGRAGLFALYAGGHYLPARLLESLGETFEGAHVSYKRYPSCRGTHPYVDAALVLHGEGVAPDQIESVTLTGNALMSMLAEPPERKRSPVTAIDAKFSAFFCFAYALVHGRMDLDSFNQAALGDARVLALAQRTRYQADAGRPVHRMSAGRTALQLRNGGSRVIDVESPRGAPANPLTESELIAKFRDCAQRALHPPGAAVLERLIGIVLDLERVHDLDASLFPALGEFTGAA